MPGLVAAQPPRSEDRRRCAEHEPCSAGRVTAASVLPGVLAPAMRRARAVLLNAARKRHSRRRRLTQRRHPYPVGARRDAERSDARAPQPGGRAEGAGWCRRAVGGCLAPKAAIFSFSWRLKA